MQGKRFIKGDAHPKEDLGGGISRQIMGFNDDLMMVKVWFEAGAVGYVHQHIHSQVSYVLSGEFEVQVNGEIQTLKAGDCFFIPSNELHGATCKKAGVLLDTFSPSREDFIV